MCILYSLIGVPINVILVAALGIIFRSKISHKTTKISLSIQIMTYVILGWIVFIMLPAIVFTYIENWSYLESVYFAFISLTTIGFGEYVSGKTQKTTGCSIQFLIF